ncbi:MAG: hypothetical protein H6975_02780 [Gammaproteobacteria bacterium]|nr:hypothetical protein [Gammaproteobacteria bacterium]
MGRLSRPLDSNALKAADDEFYANHPELIKDGKRIPLSNTDPSQADLRKEWVELYKKHGGKEEDGSKKPPAKKPDDPTQPCPEQCKPITSLTVIELTYHSDHALLKDDQADWKNEGALYPEPEWTPAEQHPISHSMHEKVSLTLKIEVKPDNACPESGTLEGTGPDSLKFKLEGVSYQPGINSFSLTSDKELPEKVQELNFAISWKAKAESTQGGGQTKNKMFVTLDTPIDEGKKEDGVTYKRMDKAVELVGAVGSTDPHTIVAALMKKFPYYTLEKDPAVPDKYDHPQFFKKETEKTGAWPMADYISSYGECQAIVRFVRGVIKQVGCPGEAKAVVVWTDPDVDSGKTVLEKDFPATTLHNKKKKVGAKTWYAALADSDPGVVGALLKPDAVGMNNFEACLKFTHNGVTKYYGGGAGVYDSKDEVIHAFHSLVWFSVEYDSAGNALYRIEEIVERY